MSRTTTEGRADTVLELLVEWQQIATDMSDFILRSGGHPVGKHEAPREYDSMSALACTTCAPTPAKGNCEECRGERP